MSEQTLYELQSSGDSVGASNPMIMLKEDHDEDACLMCSGGKNWTYDSARTRPDGQVEDM